MAKTIFTGFAPNLTLKDTLTALGFLLLPWKWPKIRKGQYINKAEEALAQYFNVKEAVVFDSGRSSLYIALKVLGVKEQDEILVQAYTCVVVSNAIIKTGAKPVYVDINGKFNMNPDDLAKKITAKSKVLIIQHTFGQPGELDKLLVIAKKHNLLIIEDCAHAFGAKHIQQLVGTFGDIGMFSFGPDKILSCVRGGALIAKNSGLINKIRQEQDKLLWPSFLKTKQHLLYNIFFYINKPLYGIGIGKAILFLAKSIRAISRTVYQKEKCGCQAAPEPYKLANPLAKMIIDQLKDVDKVNLKRREIASQYDKLINNPKIKKPLAGEKDCVYLRYPLLTDKPMELHAIAKRQQVILGNWYDSVIAPKDIDLKATGYLSGSCPEAEQLAGQSINLPTDRILKDKDIKKIVQIINSY